MLKSVKKYPNNGFTLLELMIVFIGIAALFLLTIPNLSKVLDILQKTGCSAQITVVDSAILQYYLAHQKKPLSIMDLVTEGFILDTQTKCQNGQIITIENGQATAE